MADQLSAQGLARPGPKDAGRSGFTALKAEPLAKAMGVSRGSFYWHFADIAAFHAAILEHGARSPPSRSSPMSKPRPEDKNPLRVLLRRVFSEQADAGERGSHLGQRRSRGPGRGAGDRPAPARAMSRACCAAGLPRSGSRPRANPLLGVSRLCAVGSAAAQGAATGGADELLRSRPLTALAFRYAKGSGQPETP